MWRSREFEVITHYPIATSEAQAFELAQGIMSMKKNESLAPPVMSGFHSGGISFSPFTAFTSSSLFFSKTEGGALVCMWAKNDGISSAVTV